MDSAATFLTAEEDNGPTKLYFQWDGFASHAVIVRKAPGAVILCIPKHAAIMPALEEAETGGFEGAIGPFMEVELVAAGASGRSTKRPLSSILMDFEASGLAEHVSASPSAEVGAKDYVKFGTHRGQHGLAFQAFSCSSMPDVPGTMRGSTRPLLQCSGRARARGRGIGGGCGGSAGSANRSDPNPSESAPVSIRSGHSRQLQGCRVGCKAWML